MNMTAMEDCDHVVRFVTNFVKNIWNTKGVFPPL